MLTLTERTSSSEHASTLRSWLRAILLGGILGLPILGIGSRVAMRGIAVLSGTPAGFSWGGTMTVVLLGVAAGAAAGAIYQLLATFLPKRAWLRDVLFVLVLAALTLRGVKPISAVPLALLGATMAVFAAAFLILQHRAISQD